MIDVTDHCTTLLRLRASQINFRKQLTGIIWEDKHLCLQVFGSQVTGNYFFESSLEASHLIDGVDVVPRLSLFP